MRRREKHSVVGGDLEYSYSENNTECIICVLKQSTCLGVNKSKLNMHPYRCV